MFGALGVVLFGALGVVPCCGALGVVLFGFRCCTLLWCFRFVPCSDLGVCTLFGI
ncbi:hypothetical protein HYD99_04010 [Mycoplasmopsis bovis]|nr:hypothetical protein [Mycoplasmopsis bovis]QQH29061.1 hypothetical protein HYD99_04010 [Mycoplasmopsis bovis]